MSAKSVRAYMGRMGNLRLVLLLVIFVSAGWYFRGILGGLFSALLFICTTFWASQYLFVMYDLDSRLDAFDALLSFMLGINLPSVIIGGGRMIKKMSRISKLGGPGLIIINNDSAVVIEHGANNKVLGPGVHVIRKSGERIKEIVDLRPQMRPGTIKAMTKDGLEVEITFFVGFQIDSGGRQPTGQEPYPFAEQSVLRAVYGSKQVAKDGAQLWHERVPNAVQGSVRELIATHYLEDFLESDNPAGDPRSRFKKSLLENAKNAGKSFGAQVNWVNFATPSISEKTTQQFVERWQAKLQSQIQLFRSEVQSKVLLEQIQTQRETAEAESKIKLMKAKTEAEAEFFKARKATEAEANRMSHIIKMLRAQGLPEEAITKILSQIANRPSEEMEKLVGAFLGRS